MGGDALEISAWGMRVQRLRMEVLALNVSHMDTTSARTETVRTPEGEEVVLHHPYRRRRVVLSAGPGGRPVARLVEDGSPLRSEFDPGHPHAVPSASGREDAGRVYYPNVDPVVEMVEMVAASRAYEANLSAAEAAKAMVAASLRILA